MDDVALARLLHVLAVVFWIGGVGFVTTILLPGVRRFVPAADRASFFERIERRFAWQARAATLIAGVSGLHMIERLNLWSRFAPAQFHQFWWMHAMVAVWAIFTFVLFIAEPLFLHELFIVRAAAAPEATFRLIEFLHRALLVVSLVTLAGALAGAHGSALF